MMEGTTREILFRGKRISCIHSEREWVYGYVLASKNPNGESTLSISTNKFQYYSYGSGMDEEYGYRAATYKVDPKSIGQFTGLYDKHGKRVFEGDILRQWSEYCEDYVGFCVVKWGAFNCGCCDGVYGWFLDGGDIRFFNDVCTDYEVCGNVYDNPESLEGFK